LPDVISVVIPVYGSARILPELCARLGSALGGLDYEVIFAVDGSPDSSFAVLKGLALKDKRLKPVLLRKNVGYDNAVMAGFNYARGAKVVVMDDDLQHAPEDIPALLKAAEAGLDVVYARFPAMNQSLLKKLGSQLNDLAARAILNKPGALYLSAFKVISREVVSEIVKYGGPFPYIDGLIFQITSGVSQIEVTHHPRASGQGNHGLVRSARIWLNFCTTFSILPLRLSAWFGFVISATAFLYAAHVFYDRVTRDIAPEGWVTIVLGVMLLGGIQLVVLGILGEYIGRTYMNINRKPQFVVKEAVNCDERHSG
jgi:undecaprenyl-phosphate 4-deoxy-4-formamido-L-arabinose transferase